MASTPTLLLALRQSPSGTTPSQGNITAALTAGIAGHQEQPQPTQQTTYKGSKGNNSKGTCSLFQIAGCRQCQARSCKAVELESIGSTDAAFPKLIDGHKGLQAAKTPQKTDTHAHTHSSLRCVACGVRLAVTSNVLSRLLRRCGLWL